MELKGQKERYEQMINSLKAQAAKEKEAMEAEYGKKITKLEEELKIARQGFDAERKAIEAKMEEMRAAYEK